MPPGLVRLPNGKLVPRGSQAEKDYWDKPLKPGKQPTKPVATVPGPRTKANPKGRYKVKKKKKAPPIPVPDLTIDYENPRPQPTVVRQPGPATGKKKKTHLPTQYE